MKEDTVKTIKIILLSLIAAGAVILCIYLAVNRETAPIESNSWAMGSAVTLKVYSDDEERAAKLSQAVFSAVNNTDKALSSTLKDSDISRINASSSENTEVSAFTADILCKTALFCKTCADFAGDGTFPIDITVGKLTELWNFGSGKEKVPGEDEIKKVLSAVDIYSVSADTQLNTAQIGAGQKIDMGAFGKGIAADNACAALLTDSLPAIADIGGTILLFGKNPNTKNGTWNVGIRNPLDSAVSYCMTADIDAFTTGSGIAFISTSGSYEKCFTENGKTYHHILSTQTGYPVETNIVSVTIISYRSGFEADGLSTACFTLGLNENTIKLLNNFSAEAVFIDKDGNYYATDGIKNQLKTGNGTFTLLDADKFAGTAS